MPELTILPEKPCEPTCPKPQGPPVLEVRNLNVIAGKRHLLRNVNLDIAPRQVFGLIGPSGAGKSTLLKCLNRLIELTPNLRVNGDVRFEGRSIYDQNPDDLRAKIGILFQQPVIFPTSIYRNVLFGVRHLGVTPRSQWPETVEHALREAAIWDEVKDRLKEPAARLSVGQQQRMCLARTLASNPQVILMDEPTSALDPKSTQAIEELILGLKVRHTIVLVTHNIPQARRVADWLACLCVNDDAGEVIETACCDTLLDSPQCRAAVEYLKHGD
ncbi:phosphate ABC transporter ATP-binding protein [Humisphaera borealis]|uniref:Phosphate ABC transporter ATP-binding protein n=1 Tax=Humisphaera borealis TaxID=2807512 RepID=A0A7M2WUH4_9BACT|nr:phosphate ABC transporter ATP-binding protein [Humisphaera borealis]QOV89175.1 phosphate ABC transporter ATP-binding protein [Humisphaera borealis]